MAKNMAHIENGVVVNIEWHSDHAAETDSLKNIKDRPVVIGDSYEDGFFWHDGEKVLSEVERLRSEKAEYEALINELYSEVTAE